MLRCSCALWGIARQIRMSMAWVSCTIINLSILHLQFETSFQATSGTLVSYFDVIYSFVIKLLGNSRKLSNGRCSIAASGRPASVQCLTFVDALYIYALISETKATSFPSRVLLPVSFSLTYFRSQVAGSIFRAQILTALSKARTSSISSIIFSVWQFSTGGVYASLRSCWVR